jgi:hypothetical protein
MINAKNKKIKITNLGAIILGERVHRTITYLQGSHPVNIQFTGQPDVDVIILMKLDPISLSKVCSLNSYISGLCRNVIWRRKVLEDYPGAEDFKGINRSWVDYYKSLYQILHITHETDFYSAMIYAVEAKDLDVLKFIISKNRDLIDSDVTQIIGKNGFLKGLKWIREIHPSTMSMEEDQEENTILTLWEAAWYGHLNILKWALTELSPPIKMDSDIANNALLGTHRPHQTEPGENFEIIKWLHSLTPSIEATGEGQTQLSDAGWEIFVWTVENYSNGPDHITDGDIVKALEENRIDMLNFIREHAPEFFVKGNYIYHYNPLLGNDETKQWLYNHQ